MFPCATAARTRVEETRQTADLHLVHNVRFKAVLFAKTSHIRRLARAHFAERIIETDDHVFRMQRAHKRLHEFFRRLRGIRRSNGRSTAASIPSWAIERIFSERVSSCGGTLSGA